MIGARRLLKSCAAPPRIWPIACNFCDCRSSSRIPARSSSPCFWAVRSWKQFTAPICTPPLKTGAMLTRTVTRDPSGRSMTTSLSEAGSPVRKTHSIGVSLWGGLSVRVEQLVEAAEFLVGLAEPRRAPPQVGGALVEGDDDRV